LKPKKKQEMEKKKKTKAFSEFGCLVHANVFCSELAHCGANVWICTTMETNNT